MRQLEPKRKCANTAWLSNPWALSRIAWDYLQAAQRLLPCVYNVLDDPSHRPSLAPSPYNQMQELHLFHTQDPNSVSPEATGKWQEEGKLHQEHGAAASCGMCGHLVPSVSKHYLFKDN